MTKEKPTFEELMKVYEELLNRYPRQHVLKAATFDNTPEGYRRLYNNVKSIQSRQRLRDREAEQDKSFVQRYGFGNDKADEYGITPTDERRYRAKFKNSPYGGLVELEYLRRMTGLSLKQVYILQQRTGLYPTPRVTKTAAQADQKHRDELGLYL